jgi:hypothetical protein
MLSDKNFSILKQNKKSEANRSEKKQKHHWVRYVSAKNIEE